MRINFRVISLEQKRGDQGSIPSQVIAKTQKIVLDNALLNTQYYKVTFKSKVEQSREWSSAFPYILVL